MQEITGSNPVCPFTHDRSRRWLKFIFEEGRDISVRANRAIDIEPTEGAVEKPCLNLIGETRCNLKIDTRGSCKSDAYRLGVIKVESSYHVKV